MQALNMTAAAWRSLRRHWDLPMTPRLLGQSVLAGPLFAALNGLQRSLTREQRQRCTLGGAVFIVGYWRSGTTLLHNLLCCDRRFGYPTTYACMNAPHFVLSQAEALRKSQNTVQRPMDDVQVSPSSPQEDEFALLALGARSPYEGLLVPWKLEQALQLGDLSRLSDLERTRWIETFTYFLQCVSITAQDRPLLLKSPPHGYRIATLRKLMPDARFILIVRSPHIVFESAVRMWRSLCALYALGPLPREEEFRRIVLDDRPRFEASLNAGLQGLASNRLALVRYEELVRDPLRVLGGLYERLELEGYDLALPLIREQLQANAGFKARQALPPDPWAQTVRQQWQSIYQQYEYR